MIPLNRAATECRCRALAVTAGLILTVSPAAASPDVVATITPVHALVSSVMQGVAAPSLLLPGGASPHSYSLRPSDARRLASAELIVAVGPTLESFLEKPLAHLARNARIVILTRDAGIDLLASSDDHPSHPGHTDDPAGANPHIWLNPRNAMRIVEHVATVLGEIDPANRQRYRSNVADTIARLRELDRSLESALADVRGAPFMVSHDAYAYFVTRYRLNMAGAFHRTPEQAPGARHLAALRATMKRLRVRCVFSEPQFASRTVAASLRWAGVRSAVLDPLGIDIEPGAAAYETLMRRLAAALAGCLAVR
jgi:zinc transport system substrate-binding protein